jgi:predicted double-glycine peptidase
VANHARRRTDARCLSRLRWCLAALLLGQGLSSNVGAANLAEPGLSGGRFDAPIASLRETRFRWVVRQERDFSCGSAALATLLRYHYGLALSEADVFADMWRHGDQEQIRKLGFSLLDIKRYLAARGLRADGYKVGLAQVAAAATPGIALITVNRYRHFVVVKGVAGGRVLVGDPALGMRAMSAKQFEASWNGIFFVIQPGSAATARDFNSAQQWRAVRAPGLGERHETVDHLTRLLSPAAGEF